MERLGAKVERSLWNGRTPYTAREKRKKTACAQRVRHRRERRDHENRLTSHHSAS
jgi:hypothetical protein